MEDRLDGLLIDRILEEEQKIDIRLRVDNPSAIAADGEKRKVTRRPPVDPELANDVINAVADDGLDRGGSGTFEKLNLQVVQERFEVSARRHEFTKAPYVTMARFDPISEGDFPTRPIHALNFPTIR